MGVPDSLEEKIEHFRNKGRVSADQVELFTTPSWVSVMLGQGIKPEGYDPPVDGLDEQKVAQALEQIRNVIADMAERLPTHGEFVAQCIAAAGNPADARNEFAL